MKRLLIRAAAAAVAVLTVTVVNATAGRSSHMAAGGGSIHVVEHATTDAVTNGEPSDAAGNILTFANDVYDADNTKKVGTDNGMCIRTAVGKAFECVWTLSVDAGQITVEEAAVHPERHVITRALGGPVLREPDYFLLPLSSASRVMLCSDGVTGMIDDAEIEEILGASADPRDAADRIVAAAVDAGGQDNATAVVVDVVGLVESGEPHETRTVPMSLEDKLGALP